jgi:rhodanese-related sulfurtransferase
VVILPLDGGVPGEARSDLMVRTVSQEVPSVSPSPNPVTAVAAADPATAAAHFSALAALETDCWDVNASLIGPAESAVPDGFVLLDVRSPEAYGAGHVPGAINLPHGRIVERNLAAHRPDTLFVVYCNGPHCNGADRAALRLAGLGRPVKKMIGGIEGWTDEGFDLVPG